MKASLALVLSSLLATLTACGENSKPKSNDTALRLELATANDELAKRNTELAAAKTKELDTFNALSTAMKKAIQDRNDLKAELDKSEADKIEQSKAFNERIARLMEISALDAKRREELARQTAALAEQIKGLEASKVELEKKYAAAISQPAGAPLMAEIKAVREELASLKIEKDKLDEESARLGSVVSETVANVWGVYYNSAEEIRVGNTSCRQFFHMNDKGESLQAIACVDGRIQWERHRLKSFETASLETALALDVRTELVESSCQDRASRFSFGTSQLMDRSSRAGSSSEGSILMAAELQGERVELTSAALAYNNNECDALRFKASQANEETAGAQSLLAMALQVCDIAEKVPAPQRTVVGCFTNDLEFVRRGN